MKEFIRRLLHDAVNAGLRLRSRRYVPAQDSRCVVIAPHQDDETLGCAGLIQAHRSAHLPVTIIYITDGAGSHPEHPRLSPTAIAGLRRAEAVRAMQQLHVASESLHFLDAPDGKLAQLAPTEAENLAQRLGTILAAVQPTDLFLPCRDDGSSEHTAAFNLTQRALQVVSSRPRLLEYPVWAQWSPQRLIGPCLHCPRVWRLEFPTNVAFKRTALATYVSQTEPTPPWPRPVLPAGFSRLFETDEEFFFER